MIRSLAAALGFSLVAALKLRALAVVAALLATPVAADAPEPGATLDAWWEALDEGGFDAAEIVLSSALDEARATGPLDSAWSYNMALGAKALMLNGCKFARAEALFDEAASLAEAGGRRGFLSWILHERALHRARFSERPAAAADIFRAQNDMAEDLTADETAELRALLASPATVGDSPGFRACHDHAREAGNAAFAADDLEAMMRLANAVQLPERLEYDWRVLAHNLQLDAYRKVAEFGDPDQSGIATRFVDAVRRASEPGTDPAALRADLIADPVATRWIFRALLDLRPAVPQPGTDGALDTLVRWEADLAALAQSVAALNRQMRAAADTKDWARALDLAQRVLGRGDTPNETRRKTESSATVFRARLAYEQGDDVAPHVTALMTSLDAHANDTSLAAITRTATMSYIALALLAINAPEPALDAFEATWRVAQADLRKSAQLDAGVRSQAARLRNTVEISVPLAMFIASRHPAVEANALGDCGPVKGRVLCTMRLDTP